MSGDKPSADDLRDERILAEIIAWAELHPGRVRPAAGQWLATSADGLTVIFARKYGVTRLYASGVDDGFERSGGIDDFEDTSDDYIRGYSVGFAARAYAEQERRR